MRKLFMAVLVVSQVNEIYSQDKPPPKWKGEGSGSYVETNGNTQASTLGAGALTVYKSDGWTGVLRGDYMRARVNNAATARRFVGYLRAEKSIGSEFSAYGQASFLKDVFAGISRQVITDAGLMYDFVETPIIGLALGQGLSHTNELRYGPKPPREFLGSRTNLAFYWVVSGSTVFSQETDYRYDFSHGSDWRLSNGNSLSLSITRLLAVKISHQIYYSNNPGTSAHKTDRSVLISLVARWPKK